MTQPRPLNGMRTFTLIWFGQVISILGSELTAFALSVRVFQKSGSVTQFALVAFFMTLPGLLVAPLAGVVADRYNRRWVMLLANLGSAFSVLVLFLLFYGGRLQIVYIYLAVAAGAVCGAFLWPAFSASVSLLVPKKNLVRANGMIQFGQGLAQISAPVLAGAFIAVIDVTGLMLIDIATFLFAMVTLLLVALPRPVASAEGAQAKGTLLHEAAYGWRYVAAQRGLLLLLIFFAANNFIFSLVQILIIPLILGFASPAALGTVMSVAGSGMLAGSLLISFWRGPRRRILAMLGFTLLQGLILFLAGLQPNVPLIAGAAFLFLFGFPVINGCSQAIWQSKVAPDIQGRVFAVRTVIALSTLPLAYFLAGPLSDHFFEPLLAPEGLLAGSIGRLIGTGTGRGIAFLYILLGFLLILSVGIAWFIPRFRKLEEELPDRIPDETPAVALGQEEAGNQKEIAR